jgi:hypothetical protein
MATQGYKLSRVRRDGSIGPLFINRARRIEVGVDYPAECHPTQGYAERHGWHGCAQPVAPHLSERGRKWFRVELTGVQTYPRPESQGGAWFISDSMRAIGPAESVA